MNIKNKIGLRIKHFRQKNNVSQEILSFNCGLDRTYISGVERGKRNISIINLEKICDALNVTLKIFFDDEVFDESK